MSSASGALSALPPEAEWEVEDEGLPSPESPNERSPLTPSWDGPRRGRAAPRAAASDETSPNGRGTEPVDRFEQILEVTAQSSESNAPLEEPAARIRTASREGDWARPLTPRRRGAL